ncbi:MAG: hypothetical protein ACLPY1_09705 [Terracidiphilus sp.]
MSEQEQIDAGILTVDGPRGLRSPVEVEKSDEFASRYDSHDPGNNHADDSGTHWTYTYTKIFSAIMFLMMTLLFIYSYFFQN